MNGGVYAVCSAGPGGRPIESFLIDPPKPTKRLNLPAIGQVIIPDGAGVAHLWDRIGTQHYPYPIDFIRECGRYGLSRRMNPMLDFSLLEHGKSKIIAVHDRALIRNPQDFCDRMVELVDWHCPTGHPGHGDLKDCGEMCVGLLGYDIDPTDVAPGDYVEDNGVPMLTYGVNMIRRKRPGFSYMAGERPWDIPYDHEQAAFLALPIEMIQIINDPKSNVAQSRADKIKAQTKIPVQIVAS